MVAHERTYRVGLSPKISEIPNERVCMITEMILASFRPEVGNVGVISEEDDSTVWNLGREQVSWPEDCFSFLVPSCPRPSLCASDPVHEHEA
jgi:hypothetical protein